MKNAEFWKKVYLVALRTAGSKTGNTVAGAHEIAVRAADAADDAFAERLDMMEKGLAMGIESPAREPVIKRTPVTR